MGGQYRCWSDQMIVSAGVVKRAKMDAESKVSCVHDVCSYPMGEVELVSGSWRKKTRVAVAPSLPVAVLLWRDVYKGAAGQEEGVAQGCAVVTRSQSENRGGSEGRSGHSSEEGGDDSPPLTDGDGRR